MWAIIFITSLIIVWLGWRYKNRRLLQMARKIPGPPTIPILGNAFKFLCQPEDFIKVVKELIVEYGDLLRIWLGTDLNVIVSNPDDIKLLLTNNKTSVKGPQYKYMADVLGGGILSGSGNSWRKHRKIATPNFGKRAIENYGDIFNFEVNLLLNKLDNLPKGEEINIYKYIVQCTSYVVCQTLMGLTKEETMKLPYLQEVIDTSPNLYYIVFSRMTKWYLQIKPVFRLTNLYKQQKIFIQQTAELCSTILKHRAKRLGDLRDKTYLINTEEDSQKNTQLSVIDRFLLSEELDWKELIDETFTIFTSSQEASAKISSFLLLMMAFHPKCQEKLYSEIKNVMGDKQRPVTDDDIKRMPYLEMTYKEILRLFPIGGMLQRTINDDIEISSCTLPAGSSLVIPIYYVQRDPKYWTDPEAFDPDRFSPENERKRHTYSYIPFSLGQMDCLGRYFGTKLVKTIVIKVLQKYKLTSPRRYEDLRIAISISVVSLDGYHVVLCPRNN